MPAQKNQKENKNETKPSTLKTLLAWESPERPFKKRSREFFTTAGAIAFLLGVILLFLKEWLLIMVMIALFFAVYIMSTVEPRKVKHEITTRGLVSGGKRYRWDDLGRFWFTEKEGQNTLHVECLVGFSRELILLLGETNQEEVKKILSDYLSFEEPEKTWVEDASEWLSRRVPLETTS